MLRLRKIYRVFVAWRLELLVANHAKTAKTREFISAWRLLVAKRLRSQEYDSISQLKCCRATKQRALSKLRKNVMIMHKIKKCYTSSREKDFRAGLGHLRILLVKALRRQVFEDWIEYTVIERNFRMAMMWRAKKMKRGVVRTLFDHAQSEIAERRKVRRASLIRQRVLDSRQVIEENNDVDAALKEKTERNKVLRRQREAARLVKEKMNRQIEEDMVRQQREERRDRVMSERRERDERFNAAWAIKKSELEHKCHRDHAAWRLTAEFKDRSQKELVILSRLFSPRQASTKEREDALASRSIVAYGLLDAKLAKAGITPDELFDRLSALPPSSQAIGATSFQAALLSLGLKIKSFDSIFDGLAEYNPVSPVDRSVRVEDLHEMRRLASTHLGKDGCRWKLYVDMIHRQQLLHNVWNDTIINQRDVKRKHLRKVAEDQLLDCKMLEARQRLYDEKRVAHKCMLENHAANSIQSMFWQWSARRDMEKNRWKIERRKLVEMRKLQLRAAVLIQQRFKRLRARISHKSSQ